VDKRFSGESASREAYKQELGDQLETLEKALRGEASGQSNSHTNWVKQHLEDDKAELRTYITAATDSLDQDLKKMIAKLSEEQDFTRKFLDASQLTLQGQLSETKTDQGMELKRVLDLQEKNLSDHDSQLEKEMASHQECIRDILQQEKVERFRHHASMQERIDVIETALVKEDADLRLRLRDQQYQLEQSSSLRVQQPQLNMVDRNEFDSAIQRIWVAVDNHTHSIMDSVPAIEEPLARTPSNSFRLPAEAEPQRMTSSLNLGAGCNAGSLSLSSPKTVPVPVAVLDPQLFGTVQPNVLPNVGSLLMSPRSPLGASPRTVVAESVQRRISVTPSSSLTFAMPARR